MHKLTLFDTLTITEESFLFRFFGFSYLRIALSIVLNATLRANLALTVTCHTALYRTHVTPFPIQVTQSILYMSQPIAYINFGNYLQTHTNTPAHILDAGNLTIQTLAASAN